MLKTPECVHGNEPGWCDACAFQREKAGAIAYGLVKEAFEAHYSLNHYKPCPCPWCARVRQELPAIGQSPLKGPDAKTAH